MTLYEIEKDVPLSAKLYAENSGDATRKYPFPDMEVGDSIFAPEDKARKVRYAAYAYGKVHGLKFLCRTVDGGVRVWRIA